MEQPIEQPRVIGADREFVDVRMGDLRADTYGDSPYGYQRALSESQIQAILESFEDELRKDLIVSKRVGGPNAGVLYVVDGQHTLEALKRKYPDPEQRINVSLRHWTREQEAKAFLGQKSNSRGISTLHNFKVALEHREPWAVTLKATVEAAGGIVSLNGNRAGKHLTAIAAAQDVIENWGIWALARTVDYLVTYYPDDRANLNGRMVTGLAAFFTMYPDISNKELRAKLESGKLGVKPTPSLLTDKGVSASAITQKILDYWNHGRKGKNELTYDRAALSRNGRAQLEKEAGK